MRRTHRGDSEIDHSVQKLLGLAVLLLRPAQSSKTFGRRRDFRMIRAEASFERGERASQEWLLVGKASGRVKMSGEDEQRRSYIRVLRTEGLLANGHHMTMLSLDVVLGHRLRSGGGHLRLCGWRDEWSASLSKKGEQRIGEDHRSESERDQREI
jgi:hypothetical protein